MKKIVKKSKKIQTAGLIIKTIDVGESNRLLVIMTEDVGVITAFAGGVRKHTSKLASGCGLFVYSMFDLVNSGDRYRVEDASFKELFYNLRYDITSVALASYFCEILSNIALEGDDCKEYLPIMLNALHLLSKTDKDKYIIKTVTEMRLMIAAGFKPNLEQIECGHEDDLCFDYINGGLICRACSLKDPNFRGVILNKTTLDALRFICKNGKNIYNFEIPKSDLLALNKISEQYVIATTEHHYKTLESLKELM